MKRTVHIFAFILAVCLAFGCLTGCGSTVQAQEAETSTAAPSAETAEKAETETETAESGESDTERSLTEIYDYDYTESQFKNTPGVVMLSGSWYEMGVQYGQQAKDYLVRKIVGALGDAIDSRGDLETAYAELSVYEDDLNGYFQEYIEYLHGIADGTGYPYDDVLLSHITLDMSFIPGADEETEEEHNCSDVAAWGSATADGHVIAAINSDGGLDNYEAPLAYFFLEDGRVILNAGGNCVMNSDGLLVMATMGQSNLPDDIARGCPVVLAPLYLCVRCSDAESAKDAYIADCTPGAGENMMIVDETGSNYHVEATAGHYAVRSSGDNGETDYLIANNHFITEEMQSSLYEDDSYIDCPYRYASVEQYLLENMGNITVDTLEDAESETRYYDYEDGEWVDEWSLATGLWSPLNKDSHYTAYAQRAIDVTERTVFYVSGNTEKNISFAPDALGTFCKLTIESDARTVVESACQALEQEIWAAARDQDSNPTEDGSDLIAVCREQMIIGKNYYNSARIAEPDEALALYAKAAEAYCKGQCYAKAAQTDPTQLLTDLF